MNEDECDEELRWRLELLKVKLEEGKIQVAEHLAENLERSISAVKYGTDGRIDLNTVDGQLRTMSLMVASLQDREDKKASISLQDISNHYFEIIEMNFGILAEQAKAKGYNADQCAHVVSNTPDAVNELTSKLPEFMEVLEDFWDAASEASYYHIQDLGGSKAIFGGDLFPSYLRNIASTSGLYVDTIVLSDPFWNSRHIFEHSSEKQQTYYLVKHALNVLQYKDLALAEVGKPIVVITPFKSSVDKQEEEFLKQISEVDALKHASVLFGRDFEGPIELWEFGKNLDTPAKIIEVLSCRERLLFDTNWKGSLEDQIKRSLDGEWSQLSGRNNPGEMIVGSCFGRMSQATDLLLKSRYLMGTPLIEAPTSWKYFNWKLEYNAEHRPDDLTSLHMIKGLQHVSETDEPWLGNIPPEALIEMRRVGAFEEIRNVLTKGVEDIAIVNPDSFFRSSDTIVDNIRDAFDVHQQEMNELKNKGIKFAGYDLGTMLVAGAIDIASIATGTPTFGAASFAVNQLVDVPKLREIPERFRSLKNAHKELKKSPMGMLFRHK